MTEHLYFLAIVTPQSIRDRITELKLEVAEKFNSKHALNAPPHITLHMPFKWKEQKLDRLKEVIQKINNELIPFAVSLNNFDFFEPRVVFVNVLENESLNQIQKQVVDSCRKELKLDNANYKDRPFHPHITIAFRDLKKPMFYKAKEYFEKVTFSAEFKVGQVSLLKYDGDKWNLTSF